MKAKRLQTRNRNVVDLEELHALSSAYGNRIDRKELFTLVGYPAIILGVYVFLLTYRWWTTAIAIAVGVFWGFRSILPNTIARRYESQSLSARNSFLNSLTQTLANKNRTVLESLEFTTERVPGELLEDLKHLIVEMKLGSDQEKVRFLLTEFSGKYPEDIILSQYFEQLETLIFEGNKNIDALQELTNNHNIYLQKRTKLLTFKDIVFKGIKTIIGWMMVIIAICHGVSYALGGNFDLYINGYARNIIGYATVPVFLLIVITSLRAFFPKYFDDSVTELKVRTKK